MPRRQFMNSVFGRKSLRSACLDQRIKSL